MCRAEGGEELTVAGLGSAPLGVVVLVVVCVGFLRRPVRLVTSGRGLAWRPVVVVCWVTGLDGGAAGRGVRRVVLCGAQGSWGAVGVAGVAAPTLVGWSGGVFVRGWASGDVPQADAVSLRFLEGLPQAPEDIRVVLERGEVAGVDSQGLERIGRDGFPCGLRHPPPRRPGAAALHRPLAEPMDQALEGGLSPGPLPQLPELRVGPALPPLFLGGPAVLGGGVGVGGCDGVVGTGGGGGPGEFLVVQFRGGAWGVGVHADVDPRVCAYGLRLGVGRGLVAAAVVGHALYVGCHRGLVGGRDAAGGPWRRSGLVGSGPWAWGAGFERWRDEVRRASAAARSAMKVVAVTSVTVGGRRAGRCCLRAWDGWGRMS